MLHLKPEAKGEISKAEPETGGTRWWIKPEQDPGSRKRRWESDYLEGKGNRICSKLRVAVREEVG